VTGTTTLLDEPANSANSSGAPTVSDGHHAQNLALTEGSLIQSIGSSTASNFGVTSDGHRGALITGLPVTSGGSIDANAEITPGTGGITDPVTGLKQVAQTIEDAVWNAGGKADPPNPFQWLDNLVETVVSDLEEMKPASGFQHLMDQIEGWHSSSGSGPASLEQPSPSNHSISDFPPGWQSHMIQTLASFGVGTGGPLQQSPIQSKEQSSQGYLTVPSHS
jgi:hypothetical protein